MAEPTNSSSGEEEEPSSEGSGSESEPKITQQSSDESDHSPSKNPRSQSPTGKRPAAEPDGGDFKRKKTVVAVAAPDADTFGGEKKQLFQRLWSEDNEIELIQVLTKARRLKKKFENNAVRVVSKGKVRSFSNPHEKRMYELSKNLWGSDANNNNNNNKNMVMSGGSKKVKVNVNVMPKKTNKSCKAVGSGNGNVGIEPEEVQPLRAVRGLDYFGSMGLPITDEVIMNKGLELVTGAKRVEMEAKWKNLKVQELEHFLKKVDVLKEQAEVVLNAIAKSGGK
ncbi:putative transcription factor GeBP family [Helianthus annuus]|nr:putative transcription factor GeBP family [Helianthus annuus]